MASRGIVWKVSFAVIAGVLATAAKAGDGAVPETSFHAASPAKSGSAFPVSARVNSVETPDPCLVMRQGDRLYLRTADLAVWGIVVPSGSEGPVIDGEPFADLAVISGLSARLVANDTVLVVDVDPKGWPGVQVGSDTSPLAVDPSIPAVFLDYDLSVTSWDGRAGFAAFVNPGVSGQWGVFNSTWLAGTSNGLVRLETSFVRDFPDRRARLVIGDALSAGSAWSQPLRYAGIRIGSQFDLDPADDIRPYVALSGSTVLPSTVSLVSNAARESAQLAPGAFTFSYRPSINGAGDVTMTVRDIAGNERTVRRKYYASRALLRPDVWEYSVEAGLLRKEYGARSLAYGAPYAAAGLRTGVGNNLTLGVRGEYTTGSTAAGVQADGTLGTLGEVTVSGAASRSGGRTAFAYRAGFQRISSTVSVSASYFHADAAFRQPGDDTPATARVDEWAVGSSIELGAAGSLGFSYVQASRGQDNSRVANATWGASIGRGFVSMGGQYTQAASVRDLGAFAMFTMPLGARRQASVDASAGRLVARLQKTPSHLDPVGYHAAAGVGLSRKGALVEGGVEYAGRHGAVSLEATRHDGSTGLRARASGAVVAAGGKIVATPRIEYGMVLVSLDSVTSVALSVENRPVAASVGAGKRVLVTGLQPNAANHLAIDRDALPLDQTANIGEKIVVPGWRKAVRAHFGSAPGHPARVRLVDTEGIELPAGRVVRSGDGTTTITGNGGEVFLSDVKGPVLLRVEDKVGVCAAQLDTIGAESLSRPSTVVCSPLP